MSPSKTLCPSITFYSYRFCWGAIVISSLRPNISSLNRKHPSLESNMMEQAGTLRPTVSCWNDEHPSPDCHLRDHLCALRRLLLFCRLRWGHADVSSLQRSVSSMDSEHLRPIVSMGLFSLRPGVSLMDSEHPSPECIQSGTASTLRITVVAGHRAPFASLSPWKPL